MLKLDQIGTVKVRFTPEFTRFDNLASEYDEFNEFDEFAEVGS